ncbi:MAG TPA: rhodanese-like domain-containing protein [Methylomirabilota bacterium]|nr:rhodanese-like domain-containing protein [Methylomirabilota bacterium]
MRGLLALAVTASILLVGAAPAAPPDAPVSYIQVDELKALVDAGRRVDLIDVRHWDSYVEMHIKGARSMPLRVIEERAPKEISRTGLVVFY